VILPPDGVKVVGGDGGAITRDGVQVEFHPRPSHCRALLSNTLQVCFIRLQEEVASAAMKLGIPLKIDFRQLIELTPGDLALMSPDSRKLGCLPSFNAYGHPHIQKDGEKYLIRTAAGHLHIGTAALVAGIDPNAYAKIFDVIVGNTCVLVDRDPTAAIRRKVYGRAGEYRLPVHGFEYRVLSNFWLRNYVLMSMVFGLADTAHRIADSLKEPPVHHVQAHNRSSYLMDAADVLMRDVDLRLIEQAINTNDYDLARSNFEKWIQPFLMNVMGLGKGVHCTNMTDFLYFVDTIRKDELAERDPLGMWFTEDPLTHWMIKPDGHDHGFENFLATKVRLTRPMIISGVVMIPAAVPVDQTLTIPMPITTETQAINLQGEAL